METDAGVEGGASGRRVDTMAGSEEDGAQNGCPQSEAREREARAVIAIAGRMGGTHCLIADRFRSGAPGDRAVRYARHPVVAALRCCLACPSPTDSPLFPTSPIPIPSPSPSPSLASFPSSPLRSVPTTVSSFPDVTGIWPANLCIVPSPFSLGLGGGILDCVIFLGNC